MPIHFPRPTQATLVVEREPVAGTCPECSSAALRRYPVLAEDGWFEVVKCANCLYSVSREPGPKLGVIELLSDQL
ncbi:hypothetical protein ACSVDM_13535 [Nocardia sp. JW2]|uniref:hypothetical protein n=1 Tax=Nocardia sp. JW2 TaxID=3450738 RepID=UPI003F443CDA